MSNKNYNAFTEKQCRDLKKQGYTDEELRARGFSWSIINKATICFTAQRGSKIPTGKCRGCGCKCFNIKDGTLCIACKLLRDMEKEKNDKRTTI